MRGTIRTVALAMAIAAGFAGTATAQACFDEMSRIVLDGCPPSYRGSTLRDGDALARDATGGVLYRAKVVPGRRKKDPPMLGVVDASGRLVAPAQFENIYIVSRTLGVGELALDPKDKSGSWRAFLINLKSGEMRPVHRKPFPTAAEAVADAEARTQAFVAAVMAEEGERPAREARQRAEAEAAAEGQRQAEIARIQERMKRAKEGQGGDLSLERDVIAYGLEGEYAAMGLPIDAEFRREVCWRRQSVICGTAPPPSTSASGFVSTWEQAVENAIALNRSQGQANCAAALMGASRICTLP
jgi:hypothetical protein